MQFFLSFLAGVVFSHSFLFFPVITGLVFLPSSIFLGIRKKYFYVMILISGAVFAFFRYEPAAEMPDIVGQVVVKGAFQSPPTKTERGTFIQTFVASSAENSDGIIKELSDREINIFSDKVFDAGKEYVLAIKSLKNSKRLNPGEGNRHELYANFVEIREEGNTGTSPYWRFQEYRQRINVYLEEHFEKDSGAFVGAITTGQRTRMSEAAVEAFSKAGLAHILSISGTHFGLFSVFLFGIFRFIMKSLPYNALQRVTLYLTPSQSAAILCLPFMLAYLGLSGGSIPAIRSFLMVGLFLAGLVIGRKGFWLNSLLFAAFVLVIWDPECIFSLSFQLSFIAVLFIGFSVSRSKDVDGTRERNRLTGYFSNAFVISLAASAGTAPLVAYYFHYSSLISPLSNLLIAPLVGLFLVPLSVTACFFFILTGNFMFSTIISWISETSISLVRLFSEIPLASIAIPGFPPIVVISFYAGFAFFVLFRKKRYLWVPIIPIGLYLLIFSFGKKELSVTFLDVGQGDSSVIEFPDGRTMVVDTGKNGRETASFLKYRGRKNIDFLVLSHVHPDHTGGLGYLARKFTIGEIWNNDRVILPETLSAIPSRSLERGDMMDGQGYFIHIFHPYPGFYTMQGNEYDSANNDSLVLKITGRHISFLFTGDIEEEAEEDILHLGKWLESSVIKVPHHGGKTSACRPFFKYVSPAAAVISAGRGNPFGHPHYETTGVLKGARVLRTDTDGAIKIEDTARDPDIVTYREFPLERAASLAQEMKNLRRLFDTW